MARLLDSATASSIRAMRTSAARELRTTAARVIKLLPRTTHGPLATRPKHPFWVIVSKEMADHIRSWRFIILLALIALTCFGSLYTALNSIGTPKAAGTRGNASFFFLQLFTATDGTLPSFTVFLNFLGPLLGIAMGFDAVNSELNRGTLSRLLSQPIHRDYLLNAKCIASLLIIAGLFLALTLVTTGLGLLVIGIPPTPAEFIRLLAFTLLTVIYVGF